MKIFSLVSDILNKVNRKVACLFINNKKQLNLEKAVVSFTFDDVPDSAFINGSAVLKKYGFAGTYYVSLGLMDDHNPNVKYFDTTHLKRIVEEGSEIGCHTYSHIHFYNSSGKEVFDDLEKNRIAINEILPGYTFKSFSYPYGEQSFASKLITNKRFNSSKSAKMGINKGVVDLNNILAYQLDADMSLERFMSIIEEAEKVKGWVVFYTHDVKENPTPYGYALSKFDEVVKYCRQKNIKVMTMENFVSNLKLIAHAFVGDAVFDVLEIGLMF